MNVIERLIITSASEFAANSQNSLASGSSSGPEVSLILLRTLLGSTCGNPEILGDVVLPNGSVLRKTSS